MAKANLGELEEKELIVVRRAEIKQETRRKSTNRVLQKSEVITVEKTHQDVASRKEK